MKQHEIKEYRLKQLKKQSNICCLCNKYIKKDDAALDHCHTSGHVRKVLHNNCNGIEGRVLYWVRRSGIKPEIFVRRLAEYWSDDYSKQPIHPKHKTPNEKKILTLKRKLRSVKKTKTKQKYRNLIKELQ